MRQILVRLLTRLIEKDIYDTPVKPLDKERMQKLLAFLWDHPGFREYLIDRETRFVHAQANSWKETVQGQRMENMLLFNRARHAFNQETLAKRGKETSTSSQA